MICKYCGEQLYENTCPSCNKTASLSYTSHELADIFGKKIELNLDLNEMQRKSAYNSGFAEGQKRGFAKGYDSAKAENHKAIKRQQRFFIIAAAGGAVALVLLSSILIGKMRYNNGYSNGVSDSKQEQQVADKFALEESYQQGYEAGKGKGYQDGYRDGYDRGLLSTPTSVPVASSTPERVHQTMPTPTPKPFVLEIKSKGDEVCQLQERLIILGYLAENEADGNFGSKTEKAVKQFQVGNGVDASGRVDQELWDLIMSDVAIAANTNTQSITVTPTVHPTDTIAPKANATDNPEEIAKTDLPDEIDGIAGE